MITIIFLILTPIWIVISYRNEYVKDVLIHGWYVLKNGLKKYLILFLKVTCSSCNVYFKVNINN